MFTSIEKEGKKAIEMRAAKVAKSAIPIAEKIKSWYQNIWNLLKLSTGLDLLDEGLDALIGQFSSEPKLNKDQVSSDEEEAPEGAGKYLLKHQLRE